MTETSMFYEDFLRLLAGPPEECLNAVRNAVMNGQRGQIFGHVIAVLKASPETLNTAQKLAVSRLVGYFWNENGIYRFVTSENAARLVEAIDSAWSETGNIKDMQPVLYLRRTGQLIHEHFSQAPTYAGA